MKNEYDRVYVETHDINWYAIDSLGRIALFMKGLYGQLPNFIINNRERNEILDDYFLSSECHPFTVAVSAKSQKSKNAIDAGQKYDEYLAECFEISQKGLFCYDATNDEDIPACDYRLITMPQTPLFITQLPKNISVLLQHMCLEYAEFGNEPRIQIGS